MVHCIGPMGVGAVFISTLALHRLPHPAEPPLTQQDYLGRTLQPIVAFVVLASIIIRALAIPYQRYQLFTKLLIKMAYPFRSSIWECP